MTANVEQLVGRTLGQRYRLERPIGVGGMGAVFEATQLDLGRIVAVKVLLDVDPRGIARLRQEALTAGSLSCPHVVSIFDFQAPEGEPPFIVMEILPGHSLAKLLEQQPVLPVARATRIAAQMLIGLEAAHRAGVIHRDVKPSNTWLVHGPGIEEHVKMLDFGIAKMVGDGAALLTTTGAVIGTPAYLAPEQLRGAPLDARVDIHAMGVVLFEMLSGSRPWRSETASVYAEILERQPPPLRTLAPDVPEELSQIVQRALAKDPAGRFARASDMRVALEPFAFAGASPPTYVGGLGAETGPWRAGASAPPSTTQGSSASMGYAPTARASAPPMALITQGAPSTVIPSTVIPSTVGMVPPTLDSSRVMPSTPPPFNAAPPPFNSGAPPPMHPGYASFAPAMQAAPPARSNVLPFLLGGGAVLVVGGALVAAFLLGRGHAPTADALDASTVGVAAVASADASTVVVGATATTDAGGRAVTGTVAANAKGAKPGASAPALAVDDAQGPKASKCTCISQRGQRICSKPLIPNCGCNAAGGFTMCPKPWEKAGCPVKGPNDLLPYSAPGRKDHQPCSGFMKMGDDSSKAATGTTDCAFCYGLDTVPGVPGAACKGTNANGQTEDGVFRCDR